MLKFLFISISIFLLVVIQIGFLPGLNNNLKLFINLPILFIVLAAFFLDYEMAITSALILGLFLDLYSHFFFGFFIISFVIQVLIIKFFVLHILQNKRLSSLLLLNLIAIVVWQLCYMLTILLTSKLNNLSPTSVFSSQYISAPIYQFIIHSFIILLLYKFVPRFKLILTGSLIP
jgi:hypothetical protein